MLKTLSDGYYNVSIMKENFKFECIPNNKHSVLLRNRKNWQLIVASQN